MTAEFFRSKTKGMLQAQVKIAYIDHLGKWQEKQNRGGCKPEGSDTSGWHIVWNNAEYIYKWLLRFPLLMGCCPDTDRMLLSID